MIFDWKTSQQLLQWLQKCYSTSSPARTTVYRWIRELKTGRTSTEDAPRCGRPKDPMNAEIVKQVHRIVLKNHKVKLTEIADTVSISEERPGYILPELFKRTSNRQSAEWLECHESRTKRPKEQHLASQVMASEFWDSRVILFVDFVEEDSSVPSP